MTHSTGWKSRWLQHSGNEVNWKLINLCSQQVPYL